MATNESSTDGTLGSRKNWRLPALLSVVLLGLVLFAKPPVEPPTTSGNSSLAEWTPSMQPTGETVSLTIDFGNGATRHFAYLPWKVGMTVADAMAVARDFRPGISYTQIGSGESGFLNSLEGLENQGVSGRNWLYQVDGKHAQVSFCLEKLEPSMHILWTFTDEQYNVKPIEK